MRYWIGIFVIVAAILGGVWLAWGPQLDGVVTPGVWLWDLPVGGMPLDAAGSAIETHLRLEEPRIVLVGPDEQRWSLSPADLGLSLDREATLARLYAPGRQDTGWAELQARVNLLLSPTVVAPVFAWDPAQAQSQLVAVAAQIDQEPRDARIHLVGNELYLAPGTPGRQMSITETLTQLEPFLERLAPGEIFLPVAVLPPEVTDDEAGRALDVAHTILSEPLTLLLADPREGDPGPWTLSPQALSTMLVVRTQGPQVAVQLDADALAQYLAPLAIALQRDPVDARFHFDPASGQLVPFTASSAGRELDVTATITRINAMVLTGQHFVPLVVEPVAPQYPASSTAAELGIQEQLAVGESYFTGSSTARDRNIRLGASQFDGILIAPGQTFSFNEYLGDVTPERGYDESYVIIGNRTVPGVGGGICQVATTAFRAAFYAGYPIVERWPHAYRVTYYELGGFGPGFDATVYSPLVDFRFTNDTPYHLLIETEVLAYEQRLVFRFYSTSTGRQVEQIGPTWGEPESPGPPIYEYDPTLSSGAVQQLENAHDGLSAVLRRVVRDSAGNVLSQDTFNSHFVPWSARYLYGPGVTPPPDAIIVTPEP